MADQKNQNQGAQDSQTSRTPQGRQSSQQPTSENLKNRDKNKDRDNENLSDPDRKKSAMDTSNEDRTNIEGRNRNSTTGAEGREEEENDDMNDEQRTGDRL
jgi:hypothetical protein